MIEVQTDIVTLAYKEPVPVRGLTLEENRFLKVTLLGEDYFISVLPGLHDSTLEVINFKLKKFFSDYTLKFDSIDFRSRFFNLVSGDDFLNSISYETLFNIESLLLGMLRKTHPGLFNNNDFQVNELYRSGPGPAAYAASSCLKIKIAPRSVAKTIRLISELYSRNKDLIYRLDGNRHFELSDMVAFEKSLQESIPPEAFRKIDYIEEPFKNFADTYVFQKRSQLKLAMDESFSALINLSDEHFPQDIPVVIKPSLFGISTIYNWMQTHSKKRIIISSCYEHPSVKIGLDFLARERPLEFHGLENFV